MARIVVEIGDAVKERIQKLVEQGYFKTEAEVVRAALRSFLAKIQANSHTEEFLSKRGGGVGVLV